MACFCRCLLPLESALRSRLQPIQWLCPDTSPCTFPPLWWGLWIISCLFPGALVMIRWANRCESTYEWKSWLHVLPLPWGMEPGRLLAQSPDELCLPVSPTDSIPGVWQAQGYSGQDLTPASQVLGAHRHLVLCPGRVAGIAGSMVLWVWRSADGLQL